MIKICIIYYGTEICHINDMLEHRAKHRETVYTNHTRLDRLIGAGTRTPKSSAPDLKNMATYPLPPQPIPFRNGHFLQISKRCNIPPPTERHFSEKRQELKNLPLCVGMTPPPPRESAHIHAHIVPAIPVLLAKKKQGLQGNHATVYYAKTICQGPKIT